MKKLRIILAAAAMAAKTSLSMLGIHPPKRDWVSSADRKKKAEEKRQRRAERNLKNKHK